jgi:hypothetical protein
MQRFIRSYWFLVLCAGLLRTYSVCWGGETNDQPATVKPTLSLPPIFIRFIEEKRALAESICKKHDQQLSPVAMDFFAAAQKGDWVTTSNLFFTIANASRSPSGAWSPPLFWGPISEAYGTYELVHSWSPEFLEQFGDGIVKSIPAGSIYFGGSEAGRFTVSLFSQSHSQGRPFFTLTQNALSDSSYLTYIRDMYGDKLNLPDDNDIGKCMEEYKKDAQARLEHDQTFPSEPRQIRQGEDVRMVDGKIQINGPVCVMAIHALVIKLIMDRNPAREFYYEESYELETIDPLLTPREFIFKINRQPVGTIPPETVRAGREFWTHKTDAWLGPWLKTNTTIIEITNFVKRTYVLNEFKEFKGNTRFIRDSEARYAFANLRCAIAGLYAWRATHTKDPAERQRMLAEADFAFRQAFAICPSNPGVVMRYANLLIAGGRISDALNVVNVGCELYPEHPAMNDLLQQLSVMKARKRSTQ